jgi:hypothetical protein
MLLENDGLGGYQSRDHSNAVSDCSISNRLSSTASGGFSQAAIELCCIFEIAFHTEKNMNKIFGALAVAAMLASCSLLDQQVTYADGSPGKDDPIGLKGKTVTVSLLDRGAARLQAATQTTSGTFDDITGIPSGVQLKEWFFGVDLTTPSADAVVNGAADCPTSVTINIDSLTVNIKDASNAAGVSAPVDFGPRSITLTETATDCIYTVTAAPVKVRALITGSAFVNLVTIITSGGVNTVTASLTTTTTPAIGGTIILQFGSGTGFVIAGI